MDERQLEQILNRLDILIKLTVINAFQDKSRTEVIRILSELGFGNKEIASILSTTPGYVANVRSELKKERKEAPSRKNTKIKKVQEQTIG